METLTRLKEINEPLLADKWEALFNNLGHVSRKLKKYDKALEYHQQVCNSNSNRNVIHYIYFLVNLYFVLGFTICTIKCIYVNFHWTGSFVVWKY